MLLWSCGDVYWRWQVATPLQASHRQTPVCRPRTKATSYAVCAVKSLRHFPPGFPFAHSTFPVGASLLCCTSCFPTEEAESPEKQLVCRAWPNSSLHCALKLWFEVGNKSQWAAATAITVWCERYQTGRGMVRWREDGLKVVAKTLGVCSLLHHRPFFSFKVM